MADYFTYNPREQEIRPTTIPSPLGQKLTIRTAMGEPLPEFIYIADSEQRPVAQIVRRGSISMRDLTVEGQVNCFKFWYRLYIENEDPSARSPEVDGLNRSVWVYVKHFPRATLSENFLRIAQIDRDLVSRLATHEFMLRSQPDPGFRIALAASVVGTIHGMTFEKPICVVFPFRFKEKLAYIMVEIMNEAASPVGRVMQAVYRPGDPTNPVDDCAAELSSANAAKIHVVDDDDESPSTKTCVDASVTEGNDSAIAIPIRPDGTQNVEIRHLVELVQRLVRWDNLDLCHFSVSNCENHSAPQPD